MAIVAGIISWFEHTSHKQKENNKLLSQLNNRYLNDKDIQSVIRYIRVIAPDDDKPKPYQTELFLRFFEELGVYLRDDSLPIEDVDNFFGYYLKRLYESERGKRLLEEINHEENTWDYLNDYKEKVGFFICSENCSSTNST